MHKSKNAFTIIELIFVIVILGILAAVAVPKLGGVKETADIAKGRSDVASIRSAILSERQSQLVKGTRSYIPKLTPDTTSTILFTGDGTRKLLLYGIKEGAWEHNADFTYTYTVGSTVTTFDYNATSGKLTCTSGDGFCNEMVD
jgi:general secretion pathway protein G